MKSWIGYLKTDRDNVIYTAAGTVLQVIQFEKAKLIRYQGNAENTKL